MARLLIDMQAGARAGGMTAPSTSEDVDVLTDVRPDTPWVAIVWNDPVNLMSYVTYIFETLLGHPHPVAEKLMLDVHQKGRATVKNGTRDQMESVVTQLHGAGLWATMAQDR